MKKIIYIFLLALSFLSCRKETTMWYSDWVLPLVNDTLDLKNLTNDSTLGIQNGNYILDLTRKIAEIKPSEYVKIPDTLIRQTFSIGIGPINIPAGTSFVNNNDDLVLNIDEIQLKEVRVKKGTISLEVFNPVATTTIFQINLPSVTKDNVGITKTIQAPPGTPTNPKSGKVEIDLSSYYLDLTGSSGNAFNSLASSLSVTTSSTGGSVLLNATDSTKFIIKLEGIELDYARGYFGHFNVSDSYVFESKFLKNQVSGGLDLTNLALQLAIKNSIKVSAKANLKQIQNINSETTTSINLTHPIIGNPITIEQATGSWSSLNASNKTIEFNQSNSNLENLIENLGDQTKIDYALELNPFGNISGGWDEFFPNSSLDLTLHAQMPLDISLNKLTLSDTFDVNFNQDFNKTHVESGNLILKIENAFPISGEIILHFLNADGQSIYSIVDLEPINSAAFGNLTSIGIPSSKCELNISLPVELLDQLNDIKKIKAQIELNTPNISTNLPEVISIPDKAFFKIKILSSFKLENHIGE